MKTVHKLCALYPQVIFKKLQAVTSHLTASCLATFYKQLILQKHFWDDCKLTSVNTSHMGRRKQKGACTTEYFI